MRTKRAKRFLAAVLVITAAIVVAVVRTFPPRAVSFDAPANEFSAARAAETVRAISRFPRLVGDPAYESAVSYLLERLTALGMETDVQKTTYAGIPVENVVACLDGNGSTDAILLAAHLDSVAVSPGATDDGSGVAAVLETLRALRSDPQQRNAILALFSGPEETGAQGAMAFAAVHPWARDVRLVINIDAGGLNGPSILAATGPDSGRLIRELAGSLPHPIASSAIEALGSPATDFTLALRKAGYPGFDFNLSWSKRIHSPRDEAANLNAASLQDQGEHMLAVARRFANLDLVMPKEPRPIYFDILGLVIVHYPASLAVPLSSAVTALFAAAVIVGFRRKRITARGLGFGAISFFLGLVTVPLLLGFAQLAVTSFLGLNGTASSDGGSGAFAATAVKAIDSLVGDSILSDAIRWGSVAFAPVAAATWYSIFRKAGTPGRFDFAFGATAILYLGAIGTSVAFPALSYVFVWPLVLDLAATVYSFSRGNGKRAELGWTGAVIAMVPAVAATLLLVPGIMIAVLSVDIRTIYFVPAFVVTLAGFLAAPFALLFGGRDA